MPHLILLTLLIITLAIVISLLIYQAITGVPPMPAGRSETVDIVNLLQQATLSPQAVIYELGSGWGTIVMALARAFPDTQIRGIELSPVPYWFTRLRTRNQPNVSLRRGDFYKSDLRDADAIVCYLMVRPMPKLAVYLDKMLRPGTPVVTLTFWFRGRQPTATRNGTGLRGEAALYHWPAHPPAL